MPICPGCEQTIPYDQLDIHERYCTGLQSQDETKRRTIEHLERRVVAIEKRLNTLSRDADIDADQTLRFENPRRK